MGVHNELNPQFTITRSFWQTPAGALPDGVSDNTEDIHRLGDTAIGNVPANTPTARLDVASGGRSGVDGRVANVTPLYVTGPLPAIGTGVGAVATPAGGAEFRHSNQTQGIGFAYDGIYATGSAADQALNLMQRGAGQVNIRHQSLLGGVNYTNWIHGGPLAVNQGWQQRWWADSAQEFVNYLRRSASGVGGTAGGERFWQQRDAAGALRVALALRPSATNPSTFSLSVDENLENDSKLVLYGVASTSFFGFGIRSGELTSWVGAGAHFFRWRQGPAGTAVFSVSGAGNVTVDPGGVAPAGYASPVLRFGGEGSDEVIRSQRTGAGQFLEALEFYTQATRRFAILNNGRIYMANVPTFVDNAAATAGGLGVGELYRTAAGLLAIRF